MESVITGVRGVGRGETRVELVAPAKETKRGEEGGKRGKPSPSQ